jgi:predicted transcriptional regulator
MGNAVAGGFSIEPLCENLLNPHFLTKPMDLDLMTLIQIADVIDAELVYGPSGWEQISIASVFASDLMSDVLMSDRDEMLLVTSLSTEQSIRSAGIVGSEAVVIANNKTVTSGMIELAKEQEIALFCTKYPKYESCIRIGRIMEA